VSAATNQIYVASPHTHAADYDFVGPAEFTSSPSLIVPGTQPASTGGRDRRALGSSATTQQARCRRGCLPVSLTSPAGVGGAGGRTHCAPRALGLRNCTVVQLEASRRPPVVATLVRFTNSTDMRIRWDLKNVPEAATTFVA